MQAQLEPLWATFHAAHPAAFLCGAAGQGRGAGSNPTTPASSPAGLPSSRGPSMGWHCASLCKQNQPRSLYSLSFTVTQLSAHCYYCVLSSLPARSLVACSCCSTVKPPENLGTSCQAPQLQQGLAVFVCLLTIGCSSLCLEKSRLGLCGELGNVLCWRSPGRL